MDARSWKPLPARALRSALLDQADDKGALQMFLPLPFVLVSRAQGHLSEAMGEAWIQATSSIWKPGVRLRVFNDWDLMNSYDSKARQALTEWVIAHRAQVDAAHFCTSSRLVAMGVAVANTATSLVGVAMHASTTRGEFEAKLLQQIG